MLYVYVDNITFSDIATGLVEYLKGNHIMCEIINVIKDNNFLDLYIIFGMNDFASQVIPNNYIVYQLEQTTGNDESQWFGETYVKYMRNAIEVWDYSLINYQNLKKLGIDKVRYVPLQYMKSIDTIQQHDHTQKDIDVLFYGSMNDRRQVILDQLLKKDLNIVVKTHLWNDERSQLIARSKLIINVHYYEYSIIESARLSYLLSNHCIIVSETSQDPILDRWYSRYAKLVGYNQLVDQCVEIVSKYNDYCQGLDQHLLEYKSHPFSEKIPFDSLQNFQCFYTMTNPENEVTLEAPTQIKPPIVDSCDLFEAEQEITKNQELVLKLPKLTDNEMPFVSIITVTYNRKQMFPIAIRNWELFNYPRDKLEWVIIDDSDDGSKLSGILPKSNQIKYYRLQTTGRLSIGQKRNFGVEHATYDYIVFMDDDDYYYPLSIYARIGLLLKYPKYDLVGVTDLDIYDAVNDFSAKVKGSLVSEASMAFRKSFWTERKFPDVFNTLGEGYPFTKDRRDRIIKMPSCFNLIAITHWSNYTQGGRSYDKFKNVAKKDNIMSILDVSTKMFIFDLFDKIKKHQTVK